MSTQIITADRKHNCEHLLGTFLDETHYDDLINSDTDYYMPNSSLTQGNGEHNLLFKFRKGVFTEDEMKGAHDGLIGAAGQSQNRGMAAGPKGDKLSNRDWATDWQLDCLELLMNSATRLDGADPLEHHLSIKQEYRGESTRGLVWLRSQVAKRYGGSYENFFDKFLEHIKHASADDRAALARDLYDSCVSKTTYANAVYSGIAGFFSRYPRIPYGRACAYNQKNPELFAVSFPYLRKLDKCFKALLPNRYAAQKACADRMDNRFMVASDTVFTTLTVNKTFRTAAHRDAGDLSSGFSNLGVVLTGKNFKGGYLVLPEFRVAVNIRPGDLLLINNHEGIHGNTEILPAEKDCCPECIERMSIVAYFREDMLEFGSWEYEQARANFVNTRRLDKNHPEQRSLWNGVSAMMFESEEWYEFLRLQTDGEEMLRKYHPAATKTGTTLEEFFA
jgi:hypothetical protein